jgi:hypothetical protein
MRRVVFLALVVALSAVGVGTPATARPHAKIRHEHGYPLPDRHATPGRVMHRATPKKFCRAGWTTKVRDVSESLRHKVFAEYDIPYSKHSHYEVDHLIPLELGGSNTIRNLWPERGKIPNAKDGVENELHNRVCQHHLAARKARHAIARDWVKARKHYGATAYVYVRPARHHHRHHHGGGSHSCTRTSSGSCIRRGEFCPQSDYGQHGWDAQGHRLTCTGDRTHPHWE